MLDTAPKPRPFTAEEDQRLLRLRAAGMSHAKIGQLMGRYGTSIEHRLKRLKRRSPELVEVLRRTQGVPMCKDKSLLAQICAIKEQGLTWDALNRQLGINSGTAQKLRRDARRNDPPISAHVEALPPLSPVLLLAQCAPWSTSAAGRDYCWGKQTW